MIWISDYGAQRAWPKGLRASGPIGFKPIYFSVLFYSILTPEATRLSKDIASPLNFPLCILHKVPQNAISINK